MVRVNFWFFHSDFWSEKISWNQGINQIFIFLNLVIVKLKMPWCVAESIQQHTRALKFEAWCILLIWAWCKCWCIGSLGVFYKYPKFPQFPYCAVWILGFFLSFRIYLKLILVDFSLQKVQNFIKIKIHSL